MSASKKSSENVSILKMSNSPINSDLRKSMKDGGYMTPNKTNRSMINPLTQIPNHNQSIDSKLYKMIENCVKMECAGCRKLIPTHLFYDHLTQN